VLDCSAAVCGGLISALRLKHCPRRYMILSTCVQYHFVTGRQRIAWQAPDAVLTLFDQPPTIPLPISNRAKPIKPQGGAAFLWPRIVTQDPKPQPQTFRRKARRKMALVGEIRAMS